MAETENTSPSTEGITAPELKCELLLLTPELAHNLITNSKYNRQESKATWKRYSRDMKNGKWFPNGAPIILNGSAVSPGTLLDGFHRLMAIIDSGMSFWTVVISGVPDNAIHTIDGGRPRSLGARFKIDGEHAPNVLADLIKLLTVYRNLGAFSGGIYTVPEYYDTLTAEPRTKHFAKQLVRKMPVPWLRAGLVGCLWYLFDTKDPYKATEFCECIITGENLQLGHPAHAFRDWVGRLDDRSRSVPRIANALIECWNKFRRGETVTRLRVPSDCPEIE